MYQGVSDNLLPFYAPIDLMDPAYGGDFEGELAVITMDVPKGAAAEAVRKHIILFTLFNDITYREIVKTEIEEIANESTFFPPENVNKFTAMDPFLTQSQGTTKLERRQKTY